MRLTNIILCSITLFFSYAANCYSSEKFDSTEESKYLKNIQQLTYSWMGFEKAGEAYFSPDGRNVVFQAVPKNEKHYQIYKLNVDDCIPIRLSNGYGACTCAYFRPDNAKIIFASSHDAPHYTIRKNYKWELTPYMNIYECDPDGSNLLPLTHGPAYHAECAYSPDGSRIVFASNESGCMQIYTMNSDGSDLFQVTHTDNCYNGGPFFSPDGTQIIFRADRERPDYLQIYVIGADGSNERQLTFNNAVNWAPFWHPNGKVIAFTTSLHGHRHYEIYLLNIETGVKRRLTHNATFDGLPTFSADGTKMLWTSKRSDDGTCQVFIADFYMPPELN